MAEPGGAVPATGHRRIAGGQRQRLQEAAQSGVGRLPASTEIIRHSAASPNAPDPDGLLTVAGGLRASAMEECGRLLLPEQLPEKGGVVPVPHQETFRKHGKKFKAALDALPKERRLQEMGMLDPGIFGAGVFDAAATETALFGRTSMPCTGIARNDELGAPGRPDAVLLEEARRVPERAVAEREAP